MTTTRFTGDVLPDGSIRPPKDIHLSPGTVDVIVVQANSSTKESNPQRSSLADWAEENAEHWGDRLSSQNVDKFTGRSE